MAIETLENLVAEAKEWSFEVEYGRKLEAELQRAHNIQVGLNSPPHHTVMT